MSETPTIFVAATAGRCGSSLVMQMLSRCGLKCAGEFPAFEVNYLVEMSGRSTFGNGGPTASWLRRWQAVKLLSPHRTTIPRIPAAVIWMTREPAHQAASLSKFARALGLPARKSNAEIAAQLLAERELALAALPHQPRIELTFEQAILEPRLFCERIVGFLAPWYDLDVDVMVGRILPRKNGVGCEPGLDIELGVCR